MLNFRQAASLHAISWVVGAREGDNPYLYTDPGGRAVRAGGALVVDGLICMRVSSCRATAIRWAGTIAAAAAAAAAGAWAGANRNTLPIAQQSESNEPTPGNDSPESNGESGPGEKSSSGTRTPAPFLPDDPYSPEETSRRQSGNREAEGAPNRDPDSPIPDRNPGSDQGGHTARAYTTFDRRT